VRNENEHSNTMNYGGAFPTWHRIYDEMLPLYLTIINSNGSCRSSNDANNECHFIFRVYARKF
jgi:hypothetical protein